MNVFISFSGDRSKAVAKALHEWIPYVINDVQPRMSEVDIDKGTRGSMDVANQLKEAKMGIICLTPENLDAPWLHFEAGALSKTVEKTYVCPYLFEVEYNGVKGPLEQFQKTKTEKNDTQNLINTINKALESNALDESRLNKTFDKWWPELESKLKNIPDVLILQETWKSNPDNLLR